jgi:hypothetical protein
VAVVKKALAAFGLDGWDHGSGWTNPGAGNSW